MKKVFIALLMLGLMGSVLFAEDLLVGLSYFVDEYDVMYNSDTHDPYDLDFPFITLIELDKENASATLYYDYHGDQKMENVEFYDNTSDEYSNFLQYVFSSNNVGDVMFYLGDEATVDNIGAVMATYRFYSQNVGGMVTGVGVVATEGYQVEDDQLDEFYSIIDGIRENYSSGY